MRSREFTIKESFMEVRHIPIKQQRDPLLGAPPFISSAVLIGALLMIGCSGQAGSGDGDGRKAGVQSIKAPDLLPLKASTGTPAVPPAAEGELNNIPAETQAKPFGSTNVLRSFLARGIIREMPADNETVIVSHEAIPGYMPKMTMTFNVRDTNELRGLLPGDAIAFQVKATEEESWIEGIQKVDGIESTAPASEDPSSSSLLRIAELKPGDVLPDAEFLAEDGRAIKFSDFEGSALAFTFIFTRCPLPDFCPRMNQHFSQARERLLRQSGGPTNWQFLSISFDLEYDRPGVLSRYAYSYRGGSADRWIFAAASTNVMAAMASQLDFRFATEGGTFLHNLRTVVVDPKRRLYRQFDGNKWKAEDLAQAMTEAALRQE